MYAVTADPTVRFPLRRGFIAYALARGGYLGRDLHFHKPILIGIANTHMPFMLMTGYASAGSIVDSSGGFDVGGGLNMPSPWRSTKLFVEARYFVAPTKMPVGIPRWLCEPCPIWGVLCLISVIDAGPFEMPWRGCARKTRT
jgi:hypothetical protein